MKQSRFQGAIAGICLLVLIFDSSRALEGARSGMELCIKTVIPSLFPFFLLSTMLTNSLDGSILYPLRLLGKVLGIPKSAVSILIPAFFAGYPVGAKCVGDFYQNKSIDRLQAERMLSFCSNAGPSFLFGMVSAFFPERKFVWMLWMIHIISAMLTAVIIPSPAMDIEEYGITPVCAKKSAILSAAKAMCIVCCWVILFRIVITFLDAWFLRVFPNWLQVLLTGILELTNGCCSLLLIEDLRIRFVLCSCILAFGGICVLIQTASVIKELSLRSYLGGKVLQTVFSFLLSCTAMMDYRYWIISALPIVALILRKTQKRYGNPGSVPV